MTHSTAVQSVLAAFGQLGILYRIVGSVAGYLLGNPRSTIDVDIVADIRPEQVRPLAAFLQPTFYADEEMMLEYTRKGIGFNLLHLETGTKIDIFPLKPRAYDQTAFTRYRTGKMEVGNGEFLEVRGSTPEDLILSKLEWYEMGGRSSERQWSDVQTILKVQKDRLELEYMRHWAEELGLSGLLEAAFQEAEVTG